MANVSTLGCVGDFLGIPVIQSALVPRRKAFLIGSPTNAVMIDMRTTDEYLKDLVAEYGRRLDRLFADVHRDLTALQAGA